ncbi:hypothetical protein K9M59_03395 [Candidatus Gracilibacteria bacterium]|nr:hypothetical protein [Candidatus Gracilibacteria bacterium]MCF7819372.1 hypothetical protein [Candidatus Gracilibacteria bacterium]
MSKKNRKSSGQHCCSNKQKKEKLRKGRKNKATEKEEKNRIKKLINGKKGSPAYNLQ